jgi:hypothetical protein
MSAKCYSGRIFSKNLSAKYSSIKKQHQRRYFHIPPGAVYISEAKYPVFTGFLSQSVGIMQK